MINIPKFEDIPWNGGPAVDNRSADWRAGAAAQSGRSPDQLASYTPEQIPIQPLYSSADLAGLDHLRTMPGLAPFLRGPYSTMYVGRPWTIRQYTGFSTAEESNAFYRRNLAAGQKGLSIAFDRAPGHVLHLSRSLMAAYIILLLAVLSRILPHTFATTGVGFTAVGGGLLFFGARRGRWHTIAAVLTLMATDFYLTKFVYGYAFHPSAYLVTWAWYAAVCLLGHGILKGKPSMVRVGAAVLASSTSFFVLSNFMVWVGGGMYPHTASGLAACYVAAIPFYTNDVMSTAITAGALFGLPALAASITETVREAQIGQRAA